MPIERKMVSKPKKRDNDLLLEKRKKIGDLLGLKKVPTHTLAWKEPRLELDTAECYPLVDIFERIAELVPFPSKSYVNAKSAPTGSGGSQKSAGAKTKKDK